MNIIILGNFGVITQAITPNFYYAGTWYEYFSGDSAIVTGTSDPISLEPGELRIYTDQYVTPPEPGLLETDPIEIEVPIEFQLSQNYPNPFNPTTVIEFSLPTSGMTNLTIHDLLGREVVTLINNWQSAGWHSVTWNGRNQSGAPVAAGMYIYTLKTEQSTISKKLVLLK
ncbi:MAG: T9SS type A sorting domain-containing protein [Candidatus Marinimicrobia bacterium]|nr:T9SS type A sorting domain-containing protein [Candidatus Neomarinimicrobiota bacterium]